MEKQQTETYTIHTTVNENFDRIQKAQRLSPSPPAKNIASYFFEFISCIF